MRNAPIKSKQVQTGWSQQGDTFTDIKVFDCGDEIADIDALAAFFNATFPNLGTFKVVDGDLYWTPSIQIAQFYQGNNTTSLCAYAFED